MPLWLYHLERGFHGSIECAVKHTPSTRRGLGEGQERAPGGEQSWGHDRQRQLHEAADSLWQEEAAGSQCKRPCCSQGGEHTSHSCAKVFLQSKSCSQNRLGRRHVAYALYHITRVVSALSGVASARHCSSCFHCFLPDPYNNSLRGV